MEQGTKKINFPWLGLILLIISIVVFWVMPQILPDRPVQIEKYESPPSPE